MIEDHKPLRELLVIALRNQSFRIMAVDNGSTAMRVMAADDFDVIVTDILMPGNNGLEVIGFANAAQPRARILRCQAGRRVSMRASAFAAGRPWALRKPFTTQQFIRVVTELAGADGVPDGLGE